jgi:Spy/CpxP family protein refolding chaperone
MKNFKQITALIAATSILTLATIAHAGEPEEDGVPGFHQHFKTDDGLDGEGWKHGPRGLGAREHGRLPFQLLDLTDAQKQTLEAARAAREPAMKEAHKKLRAARVALDNAGDQNADDATLNKLSADLASIIAQQEKSWPLLRRNTKDRAGKTDRKLHLLKQPQKIKCTFPSHLF